MTIRERIQEIQNEIGKGNLTGPRAAELQSILSALIGNCNDEITQRDYEYNIVLLDFLDKEKKANRAKIKAEVSPEYRARITARNTKELVVELIRSLKYLIRSLEEEYRVS